MHPIVWINNKYIIHNKKLYLIIKKINNKIINIKIMDKIINNS